jgi:hypothetical protein
LVIVWVALGLKKDQALLCSGNAIRTTETRLHSNPAVLGVDLKFGRMFEAALSNDLISKFSMYKAGKEAKKK